MPSRPQPTFAFGAEQTRSSCSEGYFYCNENSRMCKDDAATREPMERTSGRLAWKECTENICARVHADRYSVRCAGAMLAAWTAVWRHMPPANANLSQELASAGAFQHGAFGMYDPAHAEATLSTLSHQATQLFRASDRGTSTPQGATLHEAATSCKAALAPKVKGGVSIIGDSSVVQRRALAKGVGTPHAKGVGLAHSNTHLSSRLGG